MKRLILSMLAVAGVTFATTAQDDASGQTAEGKWLIEANTNFGAAHAANTGFSLASVDGNTSYSLGGEVGHFIADDLAIKAGLGFSDNGGDGAGSSAFTYKLGAKYYISSMIPVQVDYSGASIKDFDENPSYLGLQGGYAIFLGDKVSIEPGLRYNLSLNDDFFDSVFQLNIGFAVHL